MKTFAHENCYAVLQVPTDAGPDEIRRAYRDALAIYAEDSLATYSLFDGAQRETLLEAIETAFATLIDPEKRHRYDQMLIDTDQMDAARRVDPESWKAAAGPLGSGTATEASLAQWVSRRAGEPEIGRLADAIRSADRISGASLKQLRKAYGIDLSEIYAVTRISSDVMRLIEADRFDELPAAVYLKQFLKTYAEILQLDPAHVAAAYLAAMDR